MTLTQDELKHAISCYLRANAAVEVWDMTFSLKKAGIETVVETTVNESPPSVVIPAQPSIHVEEPVEVFDGIVTPTFHESDFEQLISHETESVRLMRETMEEEELVDETPEENVPEKTSTTETATIQEAISELDTAIAVGDTKIEFTLPEPDVVEEMPVQDTLSIADILGTHSGS